MPNKKISETHFSLPCVLYFKQSGLTRSTQRLSTIKKDEVAIHLTVQLPKALWRKPALTAQLTIPEDALPPMEITAETTAQVEGAIEQALGVQVNVEVSKPDED